MPTEHSEPRFKSMVTYHRDTCPVFEGGACMCENLGGVPRDSGGGAGADPVVLYERPARSVILGQWLRRVEELAAELNTRLHQRESSPSLQLARLRLEECLIHARESVR